MSEDHQVASSSIRREEPTLGRNKVAKHRWEMQASSDAHNTSMQRSPILLSCQIAGSNGKQSPSLKTPWGSHSQQGGLSGQSASLVQRESLLVSCLLLGFHLGQGRQQGTQASPAQAVCLPHRKLCMGKLLWRGSWAQRVQGMDSCAVEHRHARHTDLL